jgi:hypothetical protein
LLSSAIESSPLAIAPLRLPPRVRRHKARAPHFYP